MKDTADSLLRYAAPGHRHHAHLLPRSWEPSRRRPDSRPSYCGVWSQRWRNVDLIATGSALTLCPDCAAKVGIAPAAPRPLDIAPAVAGHRLVLGHAVPTAIAEPADPQIAHALIGPGHRIRRGQFLASIHALSS